MPWGQVVSWYPSWRHELVNDQMPNEQRRNGWADPDERWLIRCAGTAERRWRRSRGAACHLAHATCRRVNPSKNVVSGLQPKREVAGSPNFQVRSALVWIVCHSANQPRVVKIVPPGGNIVFFSLMPSSSDTLRPRDPKFGTRVHVSKGYPKMHNLGGFKN